jgi:hypothetical protein
MHIFRILTGIYEYPIAITEPEDFAGDNVKGITVETKQSGISFLNN